MICMGACRKSSLGALLIFIRPNLQTRGRPCMAVHVMHAPCIHLNSSVHTDHMRTDTHRYDHIHYRIASYAHRLSHHGACDKRTGGSTARGAAARLQTLLTCASGHAALPNVAPLRPRRSGSGTGWSPRQAAHAPASHPGRDGAPPCNAAPAGRAQSDRTELRSVREMRA